MEQNIFENMVERLRRIRQNEANSHIDVYTHEKLYDSDTWLKKPIKTVQDLMSSFSGYKELRVLDLGSGVGRNSIYIAESFQGETCSIDCVDILDVAIEILEKNAAEHNVGNRIKGIVKAIEDFHITEIRMTLFLPSRLWNILILSGTSQTNYQRYRKESETAELSVL